MRPTWLVPLAGLLIGSGGVGTWLGFVVRHQQNKATQIAGAVANAIDGLRAVSVEQRAELDRLYQQLDAKNAYIRRLETEKRRPT